MQQSTGWVDVPVKINRECDAIEVSTINGGVELQKRVPARKVAKPAAEQKADKPYDQPDQAASFTNREPMPATLKESDQRPSITGNRRLSTALIYAVFKGRIISNFLGLWEIEFKRNRRWEGTMNREVLTEGNGKWGAKRNKLCVKTSAIETTDRQDVDDIHGCYQVWLDSRTGDLTMIARRKSATPILIERNVFLGKRQSNDK